MVKLTSSIKDLFCLTGVLKKIFRTGFSKDRKKERHDEDLYAKLLSTHASTHELDRKNEDRLVSKKRF